MKYKLLTVFILSIISRIASRPAGQPAMPCDPTKCKLPDCRCSSTEIPGDLPSSNIPQIVMVSFDDAVNEENMKYYQSLFPGKFNPNACPISATFFLSHEWTNYVMVNHLYHQRHAIVDHTISHRTPISWWKEANYSQWQQEVVGQREIINTTGFVALEDVKGFRAPYLQIGGDNEFKVLHDAKFLFESSMPSMTRDAALRPNIFYDSSITKGCQIPPCPKSRVSDESSMPIMKSDQLLWGCPIPPCPRGIDSAGPSISTLKRGPALWPYTFDYSSTQECVIPPCPKDSYPGLWEVPMIDWIDLSGAPCSMVDACAAPANEEEALELYMNNFDAHYTTNRAPFPMFFHATWFTRYPYTLSALDKFFEKLLAMKDVWIVTIPQAIEWVRNPTTLDNLSDFAPWKCEEPAPPLACDASTQTVCGYDANRRLVQRGQPAVHYLFSCLHECLKCYPWVGDPRGSKC